MNADHSQRATINAIYQIVNSDETMEVLQEEFEFGK